MQCEAYTDNLADYFFNCKRTPERCTGEAKWIVSVNPPTKDNDGKVRLCDICNKFEYRMFPRKPIDDSPKDL